MCVRWGSNEPALAVHLYVRRDSWVPRYLQWSMEEAQGRVSTVWAFPDLTSRLVGFLLAGEVARAWGSKEVLYVSSLLCAIGMITIALFFKEVNQKNDTD